jgi:FkbM family methyltransferase
MFATDLFPEDRDFLIELQKRSYRPAVVYDIGASTGVWSDLVQHYFPGTEIHMFEPLAEQVEAYRVDLEDRTRKYSNLNLHATALGRENTTAELFATHDSFGSSLLDRGDVPEVREAIPVPVRRLDDYRQERGFPPPDLMKLDCQGAEIEILDGAKECLRHAKVLILECWLSREYGPTTPVVTELIAYLAERDFACVDFGQRFYDEGHRLHSVDCYFIAGSSMEEIWLRPVVTQRIAELHQRNNYLELELGERIQTIKSLEATLAAQQAETGALRAELAAHQTEHSRLMAEIHSSLSWRLTAPLRRFMRKPEEDVTDT